MKERTIDLQRTVVAYYQAPEVSEPADRAFDHPAFSVPAQRSAILRGCTNAVLLVRTDQFDPATPQTSAQRIAVVRSVGNHPFRLLARTPRVMPSAYADRRQRRLREFDLRRGCRVKVVSQRKTRAVDHHHPLRPLAPLGFSDAVGPFFAGAKLPSRNDSLHFNCWRSFSSPRNARQMFSHTPCSSQSRSRRQHVEGCGYFSGRSCQRAPLRRIHRIPSRTRRFSTHGRPPLWCLGGLGSKGAIFFHCASVSNGPARAIDPPAALLTLLIHDFAKLNHHLLSSLYRVVQPLLLFLCGMASVHDRAQDGIKLHEYVVVGGVLHVTRVAALLRIGYGCCRQVRRLAKIEVGPALGKMLVILYGGSHSVQIALEVAAFGGQNLIFGWIQREHQHCFLGEFPGADKLAVRFGPNVDVVKFARTAAFHARLVCQPGGTANEDPRFKVLGPQKRTTRIVLRARASLRALRESDRAVGSHSGHHRPRRQSGGQSDREQEQFSHHASPIPTAKPRWDRSKPRAERESKWPPARRQGAPTLHR